MDIPSGYVGEELVWWRKVGYKGLERGDCIAFGGLSRRLARVEWNG